MTTHPTITKRNSCRLCESSSLLLALPMKPSPIADAYITADHKHIPQPLFPLDLYQCQHCGHAQNIDIVNPELLFRNYIYTTSTSQGLRTHFENYARSVLEQFKLPARSLIVEIGSNDGTLLGFLKQSDMRVIGVDPACEIAQQATRNGITTIPDFFSSQLAARLVEEQGRAKLILANNVYAHTDFLGDVTDGIATLLDDDGVFVFEVSYLLDIIDKFLFDTIYHEHLSYHSIEPLVKFFNAHDLELFDVRRISTKGGSIRCYVQKNKGKHSISPVIGKMVLEEKNRGLHQLGIFHLFAEEIKTKKEDLNRFLAEMSFYSDKVIGYGASTTVTTLMYQFELEDRLNFLVDDNPAKQGRFSPGAHLEVKSSMALYEERPEVVIVLAWQYARPIIEKHTKFLENGGQFVVPLQNLEIFSKNTHELSVTQQ